MSLVVTQTHGQIEIPVWVNDLASFRKWVHSGVLPDKLPVHFINGQVWVDFSMEELNSHNRVKTALGITLARLIEEGDFGVYISDGMRYTSEDGDFSTEMDAAYVSHATLAAERVWFEAGKRGKATEMVGTPDLVIEIISRTSVQKDAEWLFSHYWYAGVPEYWFIDARGTEIEFEIFKRMAKGYTAVRKTDGWAKSVALGKEFRLTRKDPRKAIVTYQLESR